MSVYKPPASPFYHYDFQLRGHRFHGSSGRTNRREAEAVERAEKDKAKALVRRDGTTGAEGLTVDHAIGRYWKEVGQHHANSDTTWHNLERLVEFLGKDRLLVDLRDGDVSSLVSWRRGQSVQHNGRARTAQPPRLVSSATVNRSTVQLLQAVFTRAKRSWGARFDREPDWRQHRLSEPQERVRELAEDEADRLDLATRDDYRPFFEFARATGQRLNECLLLWSEINWSTAQIVKKGKQGRTIIIPITPLVRSILWPLQGHHAESVFTYVARRTTGTVAKGRRYPLTYAGVKTAWRRLRTRAEVTNFRFHDFRHDLATKLLRETGNLKLVQRALNHADIKTTTKYAHVLTDEVAEALARVQKSRKKSRNKLQRTG